MWTGPLPSSAGRRTPQVTGTDANSRPSSATDALSLSSVMETTMTVDDYLERAPEPQRSTLVALRATLRQILPHATEGISYGVPAFFVDGTPVAGYAYAKNHCSYYPHSGSVLEAMAAELTGYQWSKGALRFPKDQQLPAPLVNRLVQARLSL
jgi:uncharacterized protein YdhG (YjbR/CyaY superfamily)